MLFRGRMVLLYNVFAAIVARLPIGVAEFINTDPFAGGSMNELTVAKVDTTVRGTRFIGCKKHEIASFKLFLRGFKPKLVLLIGRAGKLNSILGKNILQVA